MNFDFLLPTEIKMSKGARFETGKYLMENKLDTILVITDPGIKNAGLLDDIYKNLAEYHIQFYEFADVKPNPRDIDCNRAAKQYEKNGIKAILTIGGGSVIDTAKAVSILLTNGGSVKDFEGISVATNPPTPIICIPTTAGTGSEVTFWSIINDTENEYKMAIGDIRIAPKLALLDVDLTASLPKMVAASTGVDALTHAIEAYTCKVANPITDSLALQAIKLIKDNLHDAVYKNDNEKNRENMLVGSLIAGIAFGNSDTASVHCISEAIGGMYDTPHGVANAIFLPYVFAYNMNSDLQKHADIAYALGVSPKTNKNVAAEKAVQILFDLNNQLDIPKFSEIDKVNPDDFLQIAQLAVNNYSNQDNARDMEVEDYLNILHKAFQE